MTRPVAPQENSIPYARLLHCPSCTAPLRMQDTSFACPVCAQDFPVRNGLPLLFYPTSPAGPAGEVTEKIRHFYEAHPFPDYEDTDDLSSLMEKASQGVFARLLDEQIPFSVRVLDCGCGTGQLANFLGIAHRTVFGTDLSVSSLGLAQKFKQDNQLDRVHFLQMNLFRPVFAESSFDYVICNGVLHHTADPQAGFRKLASLVKPGGFLIAGLYHRYGRLATRLRRQLFTLAGTRLSFLDPHLRQADLGESKRAAWFADQYQNPHESVHTISEVLQWLRPNRLGLVKTIPKTGLVSQFDRHERLFEAEPPGGKLERRLVELSMAFRGAAEGGFFTVIARKTP